MRDCRVVLIGGTSNAGKSTLAQTLATKLGWGHVSTDSLARHPGRPWTIDGGPIPEHVRSHYLSLSVEELTREQLRHYDRMWPLVETLISTHVRDQRTGRLIIEGSGIWPDHVAGLKTPKIAAIWLTASPEILRQRIFSASQYTGRTGDEKVMIEKFAGRAERYNDIMLQAVRRLGLASIDVGPLTSTGALAERCLALLGFTHA